MTTYRTISDTEVAVDAPLTQQLMQALKDNQLAIGEGASGAPRIQNAAYEFAAGNFFLASLGSANESSFSTNSGPRTIETGTTSTAQYKGVYRFKLTVDVTSSNGGASETNQFNFQTHLYKNGVQVASSPTATSQGQSAQISTHDISAEIGDTFFIRLQQTSGSGLRIVSVVSHGSVYVSSSNQAFPITIVT
jgi:hypothetical protein